MNKIFGFSGGEDKRRRIRVPALRTETIRNRRKSAAALPSNTAPILPNARVKESSTESSAEIRSFTAQFRFYPAALKTTPA